MPDVLSRGAALPANAALPVIYVVTSSRQTSADLRSILEDGGRTVVHFTSGEAFLAGYRPAPLSLLLVDAELSGMSGMELLRRIGQEGHRLPAIMLSDDSDVRVAVEAMKAGAADLLERPIDPEALLAGIARAMDEANDRSKAAGWREAAAVNVAGLTKRQRQVLNGVLAGHPSKNIAADLGISQRTVENHRAAIMRRTGSRSLAGLARVALAATWGEPKAERDGGPMQGMLGAPGLADVLETDQFRRFFDQIPLAILISTMQPPETLIYANPEFEELFGQTLAEIGAETWATLPGEATESNAPGGLGEAIARSTDFVGSFRIARNGRDAAVVDAYANIIQDEDGTAIFRLAALVDVSNRGPTAREELEERIREKDTLLRAIQQRVKNNLQMITALVRIESRKAESRGTAQPIDHLAHRIEAIQQVYKLLSDHETGDSIDLGIYLGEIVSGVMRSHAVEGIRLEMKVDAYPVSVNVALPTGLVVNELMINALTHAFPDGKGGTITVHSLSDRRGCRVMIADDGVGLPEGMEWPRPGRLGALIVRSLRQNAGADLQVESAPGKGTKVTIAFTRAAAAPEEEVPGEEAA